MPRFGVPQYHTGRVRSGPHHFSIQVMANMYRFHTRVRFGELTVRMTTKASGWGAGVVPVRRMTTRPVISFAPTGNTWRGVLRSCHAQLLYSYNIPIHN